LTGFALAWLFYSPLCSFAAIAGVLCLNRRLLGALSRSGLPAWRGAGVILLRNVVSFFGLFAGVWLCLTDACKSRLSKSPAKRGAAA
jgi:hypothetical protein